MSWNGIVIFETTQSNTGNRKIVKAKRFENQTIPYYTVYHIISYHIISYHIISYQTKPNIHNTHINIKTESNNKTSNLCLSWSLTQDLKRWTVGDISTLICYFTISLLIWFIELLELHKVKDYWGGRDPQISNHLFLQLLQSLNGLDKGLHTTVHWYYTSIN